MSESPSMPPVGGHHTGGVLTIGWRERVALPEWGVGRLTAKVDTGARTSAIDVDHLEVLPNDRVRFELVLTRKGQPARRRFVEADVVRTARVRSSTGHQAERFMVRTMLCLGPVQKEIEIGLVNRDLMRCRMLLGRRALTPEFLVDAGQRYLLDLPGRTARREGLR